MPPLRGFIINSIHGSHGLRRGLRIDRPWRGWKLTLPYYLPGFHLAFDNPEDGVRFRLFYEFYLVILPLVSRFEFLLQMIPLIEKLASRAGYLFTEIRWRNLFFVEPVSTPCSFLMDSS